MDKYTLRRYFLFLVAIFINAFGIVFITKALLGTSPITSINYVLSMFTPYTMGEWTIISNVLFVAIELLFMTKADLKADMRIYLLQIPITFCFGWSIDISMNMLSWLNPSNYVAQLCSLAVGCVILAIGIALEVKANVALVAGEYFVRVISKRLRKEFGFVKLGFDVTLVVLACILSVIFMSGIYGVREGTVIAALIVGPIVHFISPYYKCLDNWIGDGKKQSEPEAVANSNHTIITIAREYGSGGHLLGEMVAKELGIPFYDKELIELAAKKSGLSEKYVSQNEQSMSQLWLKNIILHNHESSLGFSLSSRDALFVAQCHVVRELASKGSCVIIGRCADSVLDDYSKVIKVFCYSTVEDECLRCTSEYGVEPDKAETEVKRINRARATHYEYYTGKKWGDPHNYDLMINTGSMSMSTACKLITSLAR